MLQNIYKITFLYYNDIAVSHSDEIIQTKINNFWSNMMNQEDKDEYWLKESSLKIIGNNKIVR
jgi:hypothetical protein